MSNNEGARTLARIIAGVLAAEQASPSELLDIAAAALALASDGASPSSAVDATRRILADVRAGRLRASRRAMVRIRSQVRELMVSRDGSVAAVVCPSCLHTRCGEDCECTSCGGGPAARARRRREQREPAS